MPVKKIQDEKMHDTIVIGVCLSIVGGFLDVYSYLLKGKVFANAQTGNVVMLCILAAQNQLANSCRYIIPIIAFALGIFISAFFKNSAYVRSYTWMMTVLLFEMLIIPTIGFIGGSVPHIIVNSVISFISALQVANFSKVDGNPIATTMITGNLKSSMLNLAEYCAVKDRIYLYSFFKYIIIIASFGIGVAFGCITIQRYAERAILFCEVFIIIACVKITCDEKHRKYTQQRESS